MCWEDEAVFEPYPTLFSKVQPAEISLVTPQIFYKEIPKSPVILFLPLKTSLLRLFMYYLCTSQLKPQPHCTPPPPLHSPGQGWEGENVLGFYFCIVPAVPCNRLKFPPVSFFPMEKPGQPILPSQFLTPPPPNHIFFHNM